MTMHVIEKTGEIVSPDEIIERARGIEKEITVLDSDIIDASESLKELKASREKLVSSLRAIVRPVPLFDQARTTDDTRVTMSVDGGPAHDITNAMNAQKKRQH